VVGLAAFTIVSSGKASTVTEAVDGSDVTGTPPGAVPDATAESSIEPWSMSCCVVT